MIFKSEARAGRARRKVLGVTIAAGIDWLLDAGIAKWSWVEKAGGGQALKDELAAYQQHQQAAPAPAAGGGGGYLYIVTKRSAS